MIVKVDSWPTVLPDDDGLRGGHTHCIYCRAEVGQPHGEQCVTVKRRVEYEVIDESSGKVIGRYCNYEPHGWIEEDCNFARNQSSWCKDNAWDYISWSDLDAKEKIENQLTDEVCPCGFLKFRFLGVIDSGPFVTRPALESSQ